MKVVFLFLVLFLVGLIGYLDHGLTKGLVHSGESDKTAVAPLGGQIRDSCLDYWIIFLDNIGACLITMPPKRGSRGRRTVPKKSCTVIPACKQRAVYVGDTDDEEGELHETPETPEDKSEVSPVSVPTPENDSPQNPDEPGTSSPTDAKKQKRAYRKHGLSLDQQAEVIEWFKSKPCLYDKADKQSMNTKYKELLKREQAQKMGIKCKYILLISNVFSIVLYLSGNPIIYTR